jgi:multidrug resistance efflux pump
VLDNYLMFDLIALAYQADLTRVSRQDDASWIRKCPYRRRVGTGLSCSVSLDRAWAEHQIVKRERRSVVIAVAGLLLALSAYVAFDRLVARSALPEGLIQVNGRIEGDHVTVASKFPGRIHELLAREGDQVTAGQPLVRLDDAQIFARVEQARSAVAVVEAQVKAAHTTLAVMNLEVPLAIEWADAQVASAEAAVAKAIAVEQEARIDAQRFQDLAAKIRHRSNSGIKPSLDGRSRRKTSPTHDPR